MQASSYYNPLMDWCDPAHCYSLKFNSTDISTSLNLNLNNREMREVPGGYGIIMIHI
jgi:hypothetical protein